MNEGALNGTGPIELTGNVTCGGLVVQGSVELDWNGQAQIYHKSAGGDSLIISSDGQTLVEEVIFDGAAISGVTTLEVTSQIALSGNLAFQGTQAQSISSEQDLSITSSQGSVILEGVTFQSSTVTGMTSLGAQSVSISDTLTFSNNDTQSTVQQSPEGNLVVSSVSGKVNVNGVSFFGSEITDVTSITVDALEVRTGSVVLNSGSANQSILHTGAELFITSTGPIHIQSVAVTSSGDIDTAGNVALGATLSLVSDTPGSISHVSSNPNDGLTIQSTGVVSIEGATFSGGIVTASAIVVNPGTQTISGSSLDLASTSLVRVNGGSSPASITTISNCVAGQIVVVFNVGASTVQFSGAALDPACAPTACPAISAGFMQQIVCTSANVICCL